MRVPIAALLGLLVILAGCQTPKMQTRSGRPEVTVPGAGAAAVRNYLANYYADKGYAPRPAGGPELMVFEKEGSLAASIFFGSRFNPTARYRIKLTIIENPDGVRVLYAGYIVSNPGSGFEQENEVMGDWKRVQEFLEDMARKVGK
jgi:hypothetical protein